MDINDLLYEVFQEYGLVGLLVVFFIIGPLFTYYRIRSTRAEAENRAQNLVNEFARQEHLQAERLEHRLNLALEQLDKAKDDVVTFRLKLVEAEHNLREVTTLRLQIQELTKRVSELESQLASKAAENTELQNRLREVEGQLIKYR